MKLDVFPQHSHVVPGETKVGKWVVIYRLKRVRCVLLCRNILIHLCVMWCLLMETQCTSRHLWMVLIKRMFFQWRQSNARDVHSTACTHTQTQISSDQTSSGIWHAVKKGMLGCFKAHWEAGSCTALCLVDVKWLPTLICGIGGTSELLLNTANDYNSGLCLSWCALYVAVIKLIGISKMCHTAFYCLLFEHRAGFISSPGAFGNTGQQASAAGILSPLINFTWLLFSSSMSRFS